VANNSELISMTKSINDEAAALEYAPKPGWHRRRWTRRVLWALGLIAMIGVLGVLGLQFRVNVQRYMAQRACLLYRAAADQIVYEEDPAVLQTLTGGQLFGPGWATLSEGDTKQIKAYYTVPAALNAYWHMADLGVDRQVAFMHARDGGAGERLVLVAIDCSSRSETRLKYGGPALLAAQVVRPGGMFSAPELLATTPLKVAEFASALPGTLRLYAGQVDDKDAAHFTIEYRAADGGGTIDGWLQSDDTVKFDIRPKK
jgi:hypothetical protein